MGQGSGGNLCLPGHSLLKRLSCPHWKQTSGLGPAPEVITHLAVISASLVFVLSPFLFQVSIIKYGSSHLDQLIQ
jgi:hypothetical protein